MRALWSCHAIQQHAQEDRACRVRRQVTFRSERMVAERAQAICHMTIGETLTEAVRRAHVIPDRRRPGLAMQAREVCAADDALLVRDHSRDPAKLLEDGKARQCDVVDSHAVTREERNCFRLLCFFEHRFSDDLRRARAGWSCERVPTLDQCRTESFRSVLGIPADPKFVKSLSPLNRIISSTVPHSSSVGPSHSTMAPNHPSAPAPVRNEGVFSI